MHEDTRGHTCPRVRREGCHTNEHRKFLLVRISQSDGARSAYIQFTYIHIRVNTEPSLCGSHGETYRPLCDWHSPFWWVLLCPRTARLFPKWANKSQNVAEKQHCSPLMWNMSTDLLGGTNKEVPLPICWAGLCWAVSPSILRPDWGRLSGGSDSSFVTRLWWLVPLLLCSSAASESTCGHPGIHPSTDALWMFQRLQLKDFARMRADVCSVLISKKHISNVTFSVSDNLL